MKTTIRNTFNVAFHVRRERITVEGEVPINAFITLNGEKVKINTTLKIKDDLWDNGKGKPKLISAEAKEINQKLEEIRARIFNHYHDFNISGLPFTVQQVRNKFFGIEEQKEEDTIDSMTVKSSEIDHSIPI